MTAAIISDISIPASVSKVINGIFISPKSSNMLGTVLHDTCSTDIVFNGKTYSSVRDAFIDNRGWNDSDFVTLKAILIVRLGRNIGLVEKITQSGGVDFLNCSYFDNGGATEYGDKSFYIRALVLAYEFVNTVKDY